MKKISFIAAILLLAILLSGCTSIGYTRATYNNNQSFQGLKLGLPVLVYGDKDSNVIANAEFSFMGNESTKDNLNSLCLGLQYHKSLFEGFGLYGGLGSSDYYYYPAVGRSFTIGSGMSYEGGVDIYTLFHLGYRSTSVNSKNIDMIFLEFGIPFNMGGAALWGD